MSPRALSTVVFRHREGLLVVMSVPVIVAALRGTGLERVSALLGTGVAALGVLLRLYAVRQIGRGARVFRAHARAGLVSTGPYRWTRNPLYLAAALMLSGLALVAGGGWIGVALFPATLLAYTPVVLVEERALLALFGDAYQGYLDDVPRWIGFRRRNHGVSGEAPPVAWREVLRREKGLVPWMVVALFAIAAVRSEWIPLASLARRIQIASGLGLEALVGGAAALGLFVNAVKVERHQRRRDRCAPRAEPNPSVGAGDAR